MTGCPSVPMRPQNKTSNVSGRIPTALRKAHTEADLDLEFCERCLNAARRSPAAMEQVTEHSARSLGSALRRRGWIEHGATRGDLDSKLRPRFAAMIEAMMSGKSGKDAFESAYAGLPPATLSGAYQSLLVDHREFVSTVPFKLPDPPKIAARAMSDAEVHALWARLATRRDYASSMKEIGRGLAETPGAAALLYVKASVQLSARNEPVPTQAIAELRRLDPYNPRYVLLDLLGKVKPLGDEGASVNRLDDDGRLELMALLHLLTRIATSPHQEAVSAVALLAVGRGAEARALAQKVVEANPSCQSCLSAYAEVLLGVGDPRAAKDAAERALALLHETDKGELEKNIIARAVEAMKKSPAPPAVP